MKRHRLGWGRLLFGLLFLGLSLQWWFLRETQVNLTRLVVLVPVALIVLGLIGIVVTFRKENEDGTQEADSQPE